MWEIVNTASEIQSAFCKRDPGSVGADRGSRIPSMAWTIHARPSTSASTRKTAILNG
jgi:hypothetical protein